jgi:hypothetical protein
VRNGKCQALLEASAHADASAGTIQKPQHFMGDSGEGLVDAEARIQEQIEEREAERRRRSGGGPKIDPEKVREIESLRLAKSNLERQAEATSHPVRKQQIKLAIAEIDKRLALRQ